MIRIGSRVMPLAAMPDGTYLIVSGLILGTPVRLARGADGTPRLEIVGLQTVRRTAGLALTAGSGPARPESVRLPILLG